MSTTHTVNENNLTRVLVRFTEALNEVDAQQAKSNNIVDSQFAMLRQTGFIIENPAAPAGLGGEAGMKGANSTKPTLLEQFDNLVNRLVRQGEVQHNINQGSQFVLGAISNQLGDIGQGAQANAQ